MGEYFREIKTGFNKAVRRANIEKLDIQLELDLAIMLLSQVYRILVHSQIRTIQHYMHTTSRRKKLAISVLKSD